MAGGNGRERPFPFLSYVEDWEVDSGAGFLRWPAMSSELCGASGAASATAEPDFTACLLAGTRGISVVMKIRKNNVLPFPKPPQEPETTTIVVQIGSERFAIHFEIEDLPSAVPPVLRTQGSKETTLKIVK
jgi:hypothetical protein